MRAAHEFFWIAWWLVLGGAAGVTFCAIVLTIIVAIGDFIRTIGYRRKGT